MTSVAVVGLGYWGPNLARNFAALPDSELAGSATAMPSASRAHGGRVPRRPGHGSVDELLADPELDAVVVATPVPTHADLARAGAGGGQARVRGEAAGPVGGRRGVGGGRR